MQVECTAVFQRTTGRRQEWVAIIRAGASVRHHVLSASVDNAVRTEAIAEAQQVYPNADFSKVVGSRLEVVRG